MDISDQERKLLSAAKVLGRSIGFQNGKPLVEKALLKSGAFDALLVTFARAYWELPVDEQVEYDHDDQASTQP
jgi:hypothetical protein